MLSSPLQRRSKQIYRRATDSRAVVLKAFLVLSSRAERAQETRVALTQYVELKILLLFICF